MAGREISSTLRNLKFMQRAVKKEEKKKEDEEVVSNGGFGFSPAISKKCVVIIEGDPHPGAVKGRMSFQSFNPSIDKLTELENRSKDPVASTPNSQNGASGIVEGSLNEDSDLSDSKKDHKRKQPVTESEESQYPNKSPKNVHDNQQGRASSSKKKNSKNKKNHEKNNWSVLRPPKSQGRSERLEGKVTNREMPKLFIWVELREFIPDPQSFATVAEMHSFMQARQLDMESLEEEQSKALCLQESLLPKIYKVPVGLHED